MLSTRTRLLVYTPYTLTSYPAALYWSDVLLMLNKYNQCASTLIKEHLIPCMTSLGLLSGFDSSFFFCLSVHFLKLTVPPLFVLGRYQTSIYGSTALTPREAGQASCQYSVTSIADQKCKIKTLKQWHQFSASSYLSCDHWETQKCFYFPTKNLNSKYGKKQIKLPPCWNNRSAHRALIVLLNKGSKNSNCSITSSRPLYEPVLFCRRLKGNPVMQVFSLISLAKRKRSPSAYHFELIFNISNLGWGRNGFNLLIQGSLLESALFLVWVGRMSPNDQTVALLKAVTSSFWISLN